MHLDLREHRDVLRDVDVCVVGGGTVGLALAHALAGSGRGVVVLESGGGEPAADLEALNDGVNAGPLPMDLRGSRVRALGGASRLWAGQCVRFDEEDFTHRQWVAGSGWPLSNETLAGPYADAERLMRIEGETYDGSTWATFGLSEPPLDPATVRTRMTVLAPRREMVGLTDRRLRTATNVTLATHATVTGFVLDPDARRVEGVRVALDPSTTLVVPVRTVVLAAGAIENARLLLLPHDGGDDGFGRGTPAIGRYLQDHPNAEVATITHAQWRYLQDRYGLLYRRGRRYFPRLALSPRRQARDEVLSCAGALVFRHPAGSATATAKALVRSRRAVPERAGALLALPRLVPGLARVAARRYVRGLSPGERPEEIRLQAFLEQPPSRESRVALGSALDANAVPLPVVDWRVDDRAIATARSFVAAVDEELARLALGRATTDAWLADGELTGFGDQLHHIGTTRMGDDPSTSAVDAECRVHGTANLYVAGSSVFPTSSWANPVLTALALTLRLADHLIRQGRA